MVIWKETCLILVLWLSCTSGEGNRLKVFRKDCKAKLEKFYMNITLCLRHDLSLS